jgi:hypothetical protein
VTRAQWVPKPSFDGAPTDALHTGNRVRSKEARLKKTIQAARIRVRNFQKYAQKFTVPVRIADLEDQKEDTQTKQRLEEICKKQLGLNAPARPFSAQYFDLNGQAIFYYMGERWTTNRKVSLNSSFLLFLDLTTANQIHELADVQDQYKDATEANLKDGKQKGWKTVCDGIKVQ